MKKKASKMRAGGEKDLGGKIPGQRHEEEGVAALQEEWGGLGGLSSGLPRDTVEEEGWEGSWDQCLRFSSGAAWVAAP